MNSSIAITLPWQTNSTNSVMRRPRPVSVMPPTMMPAVAVATPMPIMLREPSVRPPTTSCAAAAASAPAAGMPAQQRDQRALRQHQHDQHRDRPEGRQRRATSPRPSGTRSACRSASGSAGRRAPSARCRAASGCRCRCPRGRSGLRAACRTLKQVQRQHHRRRRPGRGRAEQRLDRRAAGSTARRPRRSLPDRPSPKRSSLTRAAAAARAGSIGFMPSLSASRCTM